MNTIYKYPLAVDDYDSILMPENAKILTVQLQDGKPCLWASVDNKSELKARLFVTFGTGQPIPQDKTYNYIGTYQLNGGQLVFHVFELA